MYMIYCGGVIFLLFFRGKKDMGFDDLLCTVLLGESHTARLFIAPAAPFLAKRATTPIPHVGEKPFYLSHTHECQKQ